MSNKNAQLKWISLILRLCKTNRKVMPIIVGNAPAFSTSQRQWHFDPFCIDNLRQSTPLYLCVRLLRQHCEREGCAMIAEDNTAWQWNASIKGQRGEATATEESQEGICIKDLDDGVKDWEQEYVRRRNDFHWILGCGDILTILKSDQTRGAYIQRAYKFTLNVAQM